MPPHHIVFGPARPYPLDGLPTMMPIRKANQRTLPAYIAQYGEGP